MKRNYTIDVVKLVLAICIALGHFGVAIISSAMVVNAFFVMSGYFLLNSYDTGKYNAGAYGYTKLRVQKIYPYYLFSFCVLFLMQFLKYEEGIKQFILRIAKSLPEIFLIQNIGVFNGGINYPLWQMCTLIVCSHIIFGLLTYNRNLMTNVIAPIVAIGAYTYLACVYKSHTVETWGVVYGFIYVPLIRSAGGICLGIAINELIINAVKYCSEELGEKLISLLSVMCIGIYVLNNKEYSSLIAFVLLFIFCLSNKGILSYLFNRTIFKTCEKLSLSIYFNHASVIFIFKEIENYFSFENGEIRILLYLLILLIYSISTMKIVDFLLKVYNTKKVQNEIV